MPVDAAEHDFLHYLTCDLPLGYPLKIPLARLLSPTNKSSSRRELLHRQSEFLDFSKRFLDTHPWITYLAAIKHEAVLVAIPTYDEQLVDVVDKLFFRDLQQKSKELQIASRAAIDEATARGCDRLLLLQTEAALIEDAIKNLQGALRAGFAALEPLPPPLPEPEPERGQITSMVAGGLASLVIGAVIPPNYGGMMWALAGLIVTGVVGSRAIAMEKARVQEKSGAFKAYLLHENYHALCRKSVSLVLTLPFETRKSALVALPQCLVALQALIPERDVLEAHYIRPFFAGALKNLSVNNI